MPVIYTDSNGQGYDYGGLLSAWQDPSFRSNPLNSRVGDLLGQNASSPSAPSTDTAKMPNDFPQAGGYPMTDPGRTAQAGNRVPLVNPLDSAPNVPAPGNDRNQIAGWYDTFLGPGRSQSGSADIDAWLGQVTGGNMSLGQVQNAIANSPEAQAYATSQTANHAAPPLAPDTRNTTTPYDGSQSLLLNAVMQRLAGLQTPVDTSMSDLLAKYGLAQVDKLNNPPFTDPQSAAMLAKNMDPLTQARDTAKQQAAEDLSRRGFTPTSGVFQDRMKQIDQAYQRGVANVTNTLNMAGIDQQTKNNATQLAILSSLTDMQRTNQQIADQRSQELVTTAGMPFNTDLQTLSALLNASGGNNDASSTIQSLLSLAGLNNSSTLLGNQSSAANAQSIAQMIAYFTNLLH